MAEQLFDSWPERYERWFQTPIGALVKEFEQQLILDEVRPQAGERLLDVGCGTGVFTRALLERGAAVVGVDVSAAMLAYARRTLPPTGFQPLVADMLALPFADGVFVKTVSITAIEFVANGRAAVGELFRVTRSGGEVVVATLNRSSEWAERRAARASTDRASVFAHAHFRSPEELRRLAPVDGELATAIHFPKDAAPVEAREIELEGQRARRGTGAFLIARWHKP